jgi:hypothetical protein
MDPSFSSDHSIVYHTYNRREIGCITLDASFSSVISTEILYAHNGPPEIKFFDTQNARSGKVDVLVPGTVPYIHQVYDTPDWHYGHGSCAPTTSMMAIAYFNKLPKWPMTASWPSPHTSDFGNYIADRYRFNEVYYSDVATTGGGEDAWGGYGYMWTGSYSPNSRMNQYMVNHQMASIQYWTAGCLWDSTLFEINHGWPQPICSMLTGSGHLTLAIGYISGQHTLIFQDPYGNKNNGYMNYYGQNACYDWPGYNNLVQNLNSVAWTVKADGTEKTYNDTLIDDIDYGHGFHMANQPPSHMRYYRDETSSCYNGHYWYTYSNPTTTTDTCWVSWTPTLAQSGYYDVQVYIPGTYATATGARYKVFHANGDTTVIVGQNNYGNVWVSLGIYYFNAGTSGYVRLGDATGTQGQYLAFDAMKWVWFPTTAIAESVTEVGTLSIAPNPADDEVWLNFSANEGATVTITICDMHGRKLISDVVTATEAGLQQISIVTGALTPGTYLVTIRNEQITESKRIIIQ